MKAFFETTKGVQKKIRVEMNRKGEEKKTQRSSSTK